MLKPSLVAVTLVSAITLGCKGRGSPPRDEAPAQTPAADAAAPTTAAFTADAARVLLGRWIDVQNRGDFDGYAALYGAGFTGVRRSGKKSIDLDRAGWLRERKRMFARPTVVAVDDVRFTADDGGMQVDLVQTWTSGAYSDRGPKRMRFVLEGGEPRIVREEMLESTLLRPDAGPDQATSGDGESVEDAGELAGSFTGKGRAEKAILRIYQGETTAPHGEESGEQGFLETARRAVLVVERDGREVASDELAQWTDGWEWGSKISFVDSFGLGTTGVDAVVVKQISSTEGGQSVRVSVVSVAGNDLVTLWEGSGDDASVTVGQDSIEVGLIKATGEEPYSGQPGRDDIEQRDLSLTWKNGKLVERAE